MSTRGQYQSLTFGPGLSWYGIFMHPSKATGPTVTKFHVEPPETEGTKSCSNGSGHMTNMTALPI